MNKRYRLFSISIELLIASLLALLTTIGMTAEANTEQNLLHTPDFNYPLATPEEDMDMQIRCFNGISSEKAVEILDLSKSQKYYSMQTYYILYTKGFDGSKNHLQRFHAEKIDRAVLIFLQLKGKVSFTTEWEITANTYFGHQLIDMPEELQKYWQNLFLRGICIDIPDLRIDSPTNPPQKCIYSGYPIATQDEDIQAQIRCIEGISNEEAEQLADLSQSKTRYSLQTYYLLRMQGIHKADEQLKCYNKVDCAILIYLRIINILPNRGSSYYGQSSDQMPKKLLNHWKQLYKNGVSLLLIANT